MRISDWSSDVCSSDLNNGQQIVGWVADLDIASFAELINLYLINQDPLARGFAALAVFQHSLDDPEWLPLAENLLESGANYRSAAAAVAAANFESVRFGTTCTDWLIRLFDDEDERSEEHTSELQSLMRNSYA